MTPHDCPMSDFLATMLAVGLLLLFVHWATTLAGAALWRWWYGDGRGR